MISGRSCQKNKVRSCRANDETDDGGSAYAASSADALSSDISSFQSGREEPPAAVPGYRLPSLENACSLVQAREPDLFQFRSLLFP